jgi:hypothetical protein
VKVPQQTTNRTPHNPAIPLQGIQPKGNEISILKRHGKPMVTAALFTVAKKWKPPKCSVIERIKKR